MSPLTWIPVTVLVLAAAAWDLRLRRIPNGLVLPFLAAGVLAGAADRGFLGIAGALGGVALAAILFGPLWWAGGLGLGDVKLAAAVGAWLGPCGLVWALLAAGMAGGIWAVAATFRNGKAAVAIPYAPALAAGTVFALLAR
jgi:prepilin peptidase CpaA